jgi:hypothetical protein
MPKTKAEYEQFAKARGHKVDSGNNVSFDQNEAAARSFDAEAQKAGFDTAVEFVPGGSYSGSDDLLKLPKDWYVRLA